jgi:hypothetical protein
MAATVAQAGAAGKFPLGIGAAAVSVEVAV